jgi:hypothetical protein
MKSPTFWAITLCSLLKVNQRFGRTGPYIQGWSPPETNWQFPLLPKLTYPASARTTGPLCEDAQSGRKRAVCSHLEGGSKQAIADPRIVPQIDDAGVSVPLQSVVQGVSWHLTQLVVPQAQHSEVQQPISTFKRFYGANVVPIQKQVQNIPVVRVADQRFQV